MTCRFAVASLLLVACGKPAAPVQPEPEPTSEVCASDDDCVVSCAHEGDCCGPLCGCFEVAHREAAARVEVHNQAHCPAEPHCPVAKCRAPEQVAVPRCRAGRCEAELVPLEQAAAAAPPDRDRCEVDGDCVADVLPLGDDACCNDFYGGLVPQARSYRDWVVRIYRPQQCQDHSCGPPPPPPEQPACALEARCAAGRCATSCEK